MSSEKGDSIKALEGAFAQLLKASKIKRHLTRRFDWETVESDIKAKKIVNIALVMKFAGARSHQQVRQWVERHTVNQNIDNPSEVTNADGILYRYKQNGLVFYAHIDAIAEAKKKE